jgi:hypothetical protein
MPIDWDRFLDPPDEPEPPVVEHCATDGADLCAGEEVEYLKETDTYHCNQSCAMTFVEQNPDDFPFGEPDRVTVTLEWPDPPEPDPDPYDDPE